MVQHPVTTGDWRTLFDGTDLSQWRGYGKAEAPASWKTMDGTLAFTPAADPSARGDLMTREQFDDFELEFEWRISEGGNSGVIFRIAEGEPSAWHTGPEIQLLDDDRHPDGHVPNHRAGALYDLIIPPTGAARPAGDWNHVRLIVCGNRILTWLNWTQTVDVEIGGDDWKRRLAASKFAELPRFAAGRTGHIALQDHGDPVWYRNVRIREVTC